MGELQLHYPISIISPYVVGGGGVAFFTGVGTNTGAFKGGAGLLVIPIPQLGIGAEATYVKMDPLSTFQITFPIHLSF